jgi:hypothetical protein
MALGLFLGNPAPGAHTLKVIVGPETQGLQLDRFELLSQPMIQRQIQPVLSMEAEELSSGKHEMQFITSPGT